MSTYTDIRYDYNLPSGSGGGLTLLQTNTITSGVASSSFTSGIDSSYRTYLFKFYNMHPATNTVDFTFNMSTDSGSNYNVTKTTSTFTPYNDEAGTNANIFYYNADDLAQSTSYQTLCVGGGVSNGSDMGVSGYLYLFNPSNTTFVKHFISSTCFESSSYQFNSYIAGYGNTTSAVDAVDFKMSSGNIDSGTIKMYGIA